MMFVDARLPLRFGPLTARGLDEAVLTDGDLVAAPVARFQPEPGHVVDCACCSPRSAAATALAGLFRARATGSGPAFRGVLAVVGPDGEAAVRAALASDPFVSGRYRLA